MSEEDTKQAEMPKQSRPKKKQMHEKKALKDEAVKKHKTPDGAAGPTAVKDRNEAIFGSQEKPMLTSNDNVLIVVGVGLLILVLIFIYNIDTITEFMVTGKVLVTVNGKKITEEQVTQEAARIPADYKQMLNLNEVQLQQTVLEQLIIKELLLQHAKEKGIAATQEEAKNMLETLKTQSGFNDDTYKGKLKELGYTEKEMENLIKEQVIINKLGEREVFPGMSVADEEAKAAFNQAKDSIIQTRASHILVCYTGTSKCASTRTEKEALDRVSLILQKLSKGEDFGMLAQQYSDDSGSASNNGDLGWFRKGMMVKEFEDTAFSLRVDSVSRAVKTTYGYHLIKVTGKKMMYEDFSVAVKNQLLQEKQNLAMQQYVAVLKQAAKIEYMQMTEENVTI